MAPKVKIFFAVICLFVANLPAYSSVQAGSSPQMQAGLSQTTVEQVEGSQTTTIHASAEVQQAAVAMWTREERLAAKPFVAPAAIEEEVNASQEDAAFVGRAGFASGGNPNRRADRAAQQEFPEEWEYLLQDLEAQATAEEAGQDNKAYVPLISRGASGDVQSAAVDETYGTAGVFTSYRANFFSQMHRYYPYRTVGKLYITGGGYCSASVISPNNIIVTAAHCVYDTVANEWLPGWTFVPADRNGAAPYGEFPWASATVLNAWINAAGAVRRYDVAVINLGNNEAGRPVTYYTGWLGRSWNYDYVQHLHAIGYPSNLQGGLYTHICAAETFRGGTDVLGMGCNMTFGSSGGPWIRVYAPYRSGALNYVNSVVSGGTPGTNTFYGPRFSSNNIVIVCNIAGC
jgi:V8-like Glu-specific endopeptidase